MNKPRLFGACVVFGGSFFLVLASACVPDAAPPMTPSSSLPPAVTLAAAPPEPVSGAPCLDDLYRAAAGDLRGGKPLVIAVHVALCDNASQGIVPVPAAIGDGNRPETNLYWGAQYGFRAVFDRSSSWSKASRFPCGKGDILEVVTYQRRVEPRGAWKQAGVNGPFDVHLRGIAWRGRAMAEAIKAFAKEALGPPEGALTLGDGRRIPLPHPARVAGFIGHNGLMDLPQPVWPFHALRAARETTRHTGVFVLACKSRPYFSGEILGPRVHNLALTNSLMAPESYLTESLLEAFLNGEDPPGLEKACGAAYAKYQKVSEAAARRIFSSGP